MIDASEKDTLFRSIYNDVFPLLARIVYRMTGDIASAEEVCQEAFIKYYERIETIPDPEQAKFWLIRVAKNLALNREKRKAREKRAYERIIKEPVRQQESGESKVLKEESALEVKEALEKLPSKLRTVLILKEYGNLAYKEISSIMGISEGNVKVRIHRAREKLATYLKDGGTYVS